MNTLGYVILSHNHCVNTNVDYKFPNKSMNVYLFCVLLIENGIYKEAEDMKM